MKKLILLLITAPFLFLSCSQNSNKGSSNLNTTVLTKVKANIGDQKFIEISKMIYEGVTKGLNGKVPITAYQNDSLSKIITAEEILNKGASEELIQMQNPKDLKGLPIDTVIRNPFKLEQISGCKLVQNITKSNDILKYSAEKVAISLTFNLIAGGVNLGEADLFYVKLSDLKTILDETTYKEFVDACLP